MEAGNEISSEKDDPALACKNHSYSKQYGVIAKEGGPGLSHSHSHLHDGHGHTHAHEGMFHTHAPIHKIKTAFLLTCLILIVEIIGGLLSNSLALLSDAGHVLTDIAAIGLTWFALHQSQKPSNPSMTYGYYRSGILAALANGVSLLLITIWILWEAYGRFLHPQPIHGIWMFVSPVVGLVLNLYMGLGMRDEQDLNIKSSVLHMLGDAAASAGVMIGAVIILLTHWTFVDPILSVMIAFLIAYGAWRIVRQTVVILMEGMPKGIEFEHVVNVIKQIRGIEDVHDLHIWSITSGKNALSCHVVLDGTMTIRQSQDILREMEHQLIHLGIGHVTIQTEDGNHPHGSSELCATNETSV